MIVCYSVCMICRRRTPHELCESCMDLSDGVDIDALWGTGAELPPEECQRQFCDDCGYMQHQGWLLGDGLDGYTLVKREMLSGRQEYMHLMSPTEQGWRMERRERRRVQAQGEVVSKGTGRDGVRAVTTDAGVDV